MSGGTTGSGQSSPYGTQTNYQNQQHLAKRYTKTGIIGRGTFGTVYRGIDNEDADKREVAIKVMDLESIEDDINNIMQEIIALRDCQSEHVPKYYHSFNIGPELWIVMEYMGGGSVHDYLDPKEQLGLESENLIAIILREVTKGLGYLHSLKMIHRDIKAANILLSDNGNVKLADFGVVGRLTETIEKRMTMIGSPYWMAPEVIVPEKGKDDGYGTPADIWSLGILGIEMANGIPPHGDQHPFEAMRRIMEGDPPILEDNPEWSDSFREFLSKCLVKDPKKRLTAHELLKLDFFKDCGDISDLKEELIDAMKEFETYEGNFDEYDDEKYGTAVYTDGTGTSIIDFDQGTLITDRDAQAALTNDLINNDANESSPNTNATDTNNNNNNNNNNNAIQSGGTSTSINSNNSNNSNSNKDDRQTSQTGQSNQTGNKTIHLSQNSSPNNSLTEITKVGQLKKGGQYSQSSKHVMRLSNSPIAVPGPRHSRQFSKRKSTAAAIRAHRKLNKQKSYNMSIEWTENRPSLNMLRVPLTGSDVPVSPTGGSIDLYDNNNSNSKKKGKSKSAMTANTASNATLHQQSQSPGPKDDTLTDDNDEWEYGGTIVRGTNISLDRENSKSNSKPVNYRQLSVQTYDIGIQTDYKHTYEKAVQTDSYTVSHLVGIRKDIEAICDNMENELSDQGKEYLESLKAKIKDLTRFKITERRMKSTNLEDNLEAQRRRNEIRAQSQVLNNSDIQQTQNRLRDIRTRLDARTTSKNKI